MNFCWIGPRRIKNVVNDLVYDVATLDGSKVERFHRFRLKLYCVSDENTPVLPEMLELAERTESTYEIV